MPSRYDRHESQYLARVPGSDGTFAFWPNFTDLVPNAYPEKFVLPKHMLFCLLRAHVDSVFSAIVVSFIPYYFTHTLLTSTSKDKVGKELHRTP